MIFSPGEKHSGPTGKVARLLLTRNFESRILLNSRLLSSDKIKLILHCANETLKLIYTNAILNKEDSEDLMYGARNLIIFFKTEILANEAWHVLIDEMISRPYCLWGHSVNVSFYSLFLADALRDRSVVKMGPEQLQNLCLGSLIHDIGKKLIDREIVEKNGSLSKEEFEVMKTHPELGVEIISSNDYLPEDVLKVVLQHHEEWEGRGYPNRINYQQISHLSRIVSIADTFDALTSFKPYRKPFAPFEALVIMKRNMPGKFYHIYLDVFIASLGKAAVR